MPIGAGIRWNWLKAESMNLARSAGLYVQLMRGIPEAALRREYRRRILRLLRTRPAPYVLFVYLLKCAIHYHYYTFARQMAAQPDRVVNSF